MSVPACSFPKLEKEARKKSLPWSFFTIFDPLLQPIQRGLFKMVSRWVCLSCVPFLSCVVVSHSVQTGSFYAAVKLMATSPSGGLV